MEEHIIKNGGYNDIFNDRTLDKNGNVVSFTKRVNDFSIIKHLLSSNNKKKLSLKQYRFLMQVQAGNRISPKQREWLKTLRKDC
tara:strand:+ start:450 stop:701 length:252 start_codon:yes stop_codon:yes gene_type:complete